MFEAIRHYAEKLRRAHSSGDGPTIRAYEAHLRSAIASIDKGAGGQPVEDLEKTRDALERHLANSGCDGVLSFLAGYEDGFAPRVPAEFNDAYYDGYMLADELRGKGRRR